jgi:transposase-like protein
VPKRRWAGEVRNVSLLVAIAVNNDGYREILGICEGAKEDKAGFVLILPRDRKEARSCHGAQPAHS